MANDGKKAATVPVWLVLAVALGGACLFLMPTSAPGPAQAVTVYEKPPVTMESPKALEKLRAKLDAEKAAEKDAASLPKPVVSDRKRKILDQEKAQQAKMAKALEKSAPKEDKPKPAPKLPPVKKEFARFVSTLRATDYAGDIVLAAGPPEKFQRGVEDYLRGEGVLAYQFTYECVKKKRRRLLMTPAGCTLTNWYAKGDQRGPRPLAVSRYEMYRTWLSFYEDTSWGIIFDFRDTFFQRDPFTIVDKSPSAPNLHLFAENRQVKTVGNCIFNSGWLRCWGKETPKKYSNNSVVCSGSTMGSAPALRQYTERMVAEMDKMNGELARLPGVKVTHHEQGHGIVNTIGAMNGFRVPAHMKGPLDTHWKIKDKDGYILDYDGQKSAVVHQWDRFHKECVNHIDRLANAYMRDKKAKLASA
ncbi:hypothetical protein JL720_9548 [Aureococcus anophagefferens]|nr:hypothetical protein JL720_9548 [Aureococcus anophagefferens]